jgi:hypothetical protein
MGRAQPKSLPDLTPDRLIERVAEAVRVGMEPAKLRSFPAWTQRVMRILKDQFLPREFAAIFAADQSVFAEGVAVAWMAKAREAQQTPAASGGRIARRLADRLAMDAASRDAAVQVESGAIAASDDFQKHIMNRLFAPDFAQRGAFAEGLAVGNRLPELLNRQAKRSTTDATGIYLLLWFYWPEISKLRSIGEVARVLEPFFAENKSLAGAHWEERIRKLANRIGLSFRAQQTRRRIVGDV